MRLPSFHRNWFRVQISSEVIMKQICEKFDLTEEAAKNI